MALYDNLPHRVTSHTVTSSTDAGGGVTLSYTSAQAAIPCSINTARAAEVAQYSQQQIRVTHTVAFLASALTTALTRGMKLIADDTAKSFHIHGIRTGRGYGSIPAFTYAECEELL